MMEPIPSHAILYMYTAGQPEGFIKRYIESIFTPQAQEIVTKLALSLYSLNKTLSQYPHDQFYAGA